jgi:hypothetical protein
MHNTVGSVRVSPYRKRQFACAVLLLWFIRSYTTYAQAPLVFVSPTRPFIVLELYSSQGCSSCPPAEHWVSQFVDSPALFSQVFPLVFHVDYWDYIGWSDPFALAEFSQRQQRFKQAGKIKAVYTPGFVVNGKEWRGWFSQPRSTAYLLAQKGMETTDSLQLSVSKDQFNITLKDATGRHLNNSERYANSTLNIALLGMGLRIAVSRGENASKILLEDFVVLRFTQYTWQAEQVLALPRTKIHAPRYALLVYLSSADGLSPRLAAGGLLPADWQG